jgi:hypothetical protein
MTLPTNLILPLQTDRLKTGKHEDLEAYLNDLIFRIEGMYEQVAEGVNGTFHNNFLQTDEKWIPIIKDTLNSSTTFTYDHQIGWSFRRGLLVDCWFDIEWTASSGAITGDMYLELPYKVALSDEMPFTGSLQPSSFTFTGGSEAVINAIPNTFRGEIWNTGDGFPTANQGSTSSGRLIGHIRYIGQQNE